MAPGLENISTMIGSSTSASKSPTAPPPVKEGTPRRRVSKDFPDIPANPIDMPDTVGRHRIRPTLRPHRHGETRSPYIALLSVRAAIDPEAQGLAGEQQYSDYRLRYYHRCHLAE